MAIRHGLAGQFGKNEANKRSQRMLALLYWIAALSLAGLGVAYGYSIAHHGPWGPLVAMIVLACVFPLLWRPISRHIDKTSRERIRYMRGGQGEALVAWLLEDLEDDWHVFNGIKLEAASDIDHIVAGPGGVFCISTKANRGLFTGTRDGLHHNGQPSPFAQQALRQTMNLKDRLAALMGADVPWVQPVLALPFGFIEGDACDGKVWMVHQDELTDRIAPENGPKRLSKDALRRVVKVLEMIQIGAADVYQRENARVPRAQ